MDVYPERDEVTTAFRREYCTQRTVQVLEIKRQRIRDDLQQFVSHIGQIVPPRVLEVKRQRIRNDLQQFVSHLGLIVPQAETGDDFPSEILQDALDRLGDEAFAQCVRQIFQKG
jgi:ribosomal protein S18